MNSQFTLWAFSCMLATVSLFLNMIMSTVTIAAFGGNSFLTGVLHSRSLIFVLVVWAFFSTPMLYIFLLRDKRRREEFRSICVKSIVMAPLVVSGFVLYFWQGKEVIALVLIWVSLVFFTYQSLVRYPDTLE